MRPDSVFETALASVQRNEDGSFKEEDLIAAIAAILKVDSAQMARNMAKKMISSRMRPGRTEASGQLVLPLLGNQPYAYEPDKLIKGDSGNVINQDRALPAYKSAEWRRRRKNRELVEQYEKRSAEETMAYSEWYVKEIERGATDRAELTFGAFVRKTGWWRPGEAPKAGLTDEDEE